MPAMSALQAGVQVREKLVELAAQVSPEDRHDIFYAEQVLGSVGLLPSAVNVLAMLRLLEKHDISRDSAPAYPKAMPDGSVVHSVGQEEDWQRRQDKNKPAKVEAEKS